MSSKINPLPIDPIVANKVIEAQAASDKMRLERGVIGVLFGTRDHAPFNIAAVVVVLCLSIAGYMIAFGSGFSQNKDALTYLGGFVTVALGYIFGKSSKD